MKDELMRLLDEYRETESAMEKYMGLLDEKDYAQGKLDVVKIIISDLENLVKEI